jgi:hypothetical protein
VVRERNGRAAVVGGAAAKPVYAASPIQKRVLTMDVKMNERTHRTAYRTPIDASS